MSLILKQEKDYSSPLCIPILLSGAFELEIINRQILDVWKQVLIRSAIWMAEAMRTSGLNGQSENASTRGLNCWAVIRRAQSLVSKRSSGGNDSAATFLSSEAAPGAKDLCSTSSYCVFHMREYGSPTRLY